MGRPQAAMQRGSEIGIRWGGRRPPVQGVLAGYPVPDQRLQLAAVRPGGVEPGLIAAHDVAQLQAMGRWA
jgi:hypothetical protein